MNTESTGTEAARAAGPWTTPGAMLGRGRYRLVDEVGSDVRCGARFWRGRDAVLERDVAITLFIGEPGDAAAADAIRGAVQQALRTARLDTAGAARVLDVLEPEPGPGPTVAAVIAEWTHGRDLLELVRAGLTAPSVAAGMLEPLAGAVDDAHRAGLVLGCDHPQRIRVTADGNARLAFPGAPAGAVPRDDVRGLGAALYLLLTGRWALDGGPTALPTAPRGPEGGVVSPRSLRPIVPLELSTLAVRSLSGSATGGVHTGAAVQRVLERSAVPSDAELLAADDGSVRAAVWHDPDEETPPSAERRKKLGIGVAALVVASLLIIGWLAVQVGLVFTGGGDEPPALVIEGEPPANSAAAPAPPSAGPVTVEDVAVYDVLGTGDPDNPADAPQAVDGEQRTSWATDSYVEDFPDFKPGVGLLLTLAESVPLASVTVESPSEGTVVEIRSATSDDAEYEDTTLVGRVTLTDGTTEIPLEAGPPTRYLVVWITTLAGSGDDNRSELDELTVLRAG